MNKKNFLGIWKLVSFRLIYNDQKIIHPYGENPIGTIIYTDVDYMSVHIMHRKRIKCHSNNPRQISTKEKEEISDNYNGYSGRYMVDNTTNTIHHYPEISSFPNGCSMVLARKYEFEDNKLILYGVPTLEEFYPHLIWERMNSK